MTTFTFTIETIHLEKFLTTSFAWLVVIDVSDCNFFTCADRTFGLQSHSPRLYVPIPLRIGLTT
jgi:hypothetical protein